jgi:hypothetical protein
MRYFFHIMNGQGRTDDDEGSELASLDEARAHAVDGIRSMLADETRRGHMDLNGRIEVTDADGAELAVVHFQDAVSIVGAATDQQGAAGYDRASAPQA